MEELDPINSLGTAQSRQKRLDSTPGSKSTDPQQADASSQSKDFVLPTMSSYSDPNKPVLLNDVLQVAQSIDEKVLEPAPKSLQPPTPTDRTKIAYSRADADDIASMDVLTAIDNDWKNVIPDENDRRTTYILMARACYDNGTSPYTTYGGVYKVRSTEFRLSDLAAVIRGYTTMRRFAGHWAKTIYSLAVYDNEPPSKWAKRGFSYNTRFAAFDFFNALTSPQSPPPKGVPEITPPDSEIAANLTHKQIALARSTNKLRLLQPEVTSGGLCQPKPIAYVSGGCSG